MRRISRALPKQPSCRLAVEVLEDRLAPAGNLQSLLGLSQLQSEFPSVTGAGYTVALLDTGINYNLSSLGGGVGTGHRVIYAYNFLNNSSNALDDNGHGTFLANMIGSSSSSDLGIAPQVQFADLKVLDSNMNGSWTAIENALQWVIDNKVQDNIVAINMSFSSGNYSTDDYDLVESDLATLKSMGVFISVASGNNFATYNSAPGLSYPAVDPDVVSVGATWAGSYGAQTYNGATDNSTALNQFADFTQRNGNLSILAPGAWITTIGMSGSETTLGGTSMATAVVTGAAVLLHQELDQAGESSQTGEQDLLQLMQSTGTSVVDNATSAMTNVTPTGLTFKELNLQAAMTAADSSTALSIGTIADQTMLVGGTITVALPINHAANDPVTITPQVVYFPALAYQLKQQYGLTSTGNYNTNYDGYSEKWLSGSNGATYWLMPNGALYHYTGATTTIQPANLLGTLNSSYYADPTLLYNASYAGNPPAVLSVTGNNLSIRSPAYWVGTYMVSVAVTDAQGHSVTGSFNLTVNPAPPVLTPIANKTVSHVSNTVNVTLHATEAENGPVSYGAQVLSVNGQTPAVTVSVQGNHLTLSTPVSFVGVYTVQVSASDLPAVITETFTVTVTNAAPTLAAIATKTMAAGKTSLTFALTAADANHDSLTYQAVAETPSASLYQLDQQYGFHKYNGSYYVNLWGQHEKWLVGENNVWYMLLPSGQLYRWAQSVAATLQPPNLIATLSPAVYAQPALLWNAQPPTTPALTFSFVGNRLTIHRPAGLTGVFFIDVSVSDGLTTTMKTFELVLN
jgi:Subtilase family